MEPPHVTERNKFLNALNNEPTSTAMLQSLWRKFFRISLWLCDQPDPGSSTYVYTMLGHELLGEEFMSFRGITCKMRIEVVTYGSHSTETTNLFLLKTEVYSH